MTKARSGVTSRGRDELLFVGMAAAVIAFIVVLNGFNTFHDRARMGQGVELWEPLVWEGSSGLVVLAMTPLLMAFTRRVWPFDPPIRLKFVLHVMAAFVFSLIHVAAMGAMRSAVYALADARYDPLGPLADWPYELRKDVIVYAAMVAIYVAWRLLRARPAPQGPAEPDVLEVRDGARRHFVTLADVQWVEAAGNYVELHRSGAPLLHRASLSEMERRLSGSGFVRIHRSRLVRRGAVAAVESKPAGDFMVRLRDGRELAGSRRFRRPLLAD